DVGQLSDNHRPFWSVRILLRRSFSPLADYHPHCRFLHRHSDIFWGPEPASTRHYSLRNIFDSVLCDRLGRPICSQQICNNKPLIHNCELARLQEFETPFPLVKASPNSAAHPEPLKRRTLSHSSSRRPGGRER